MANDKKPKPMPNPSPASVVAPTSGMWRNTTAPLNGSAPSNGNAK